MGSFMSVGGQSPSMLGVSFTTLPIKTSMSKTAMTKRFATP